MPRIWPLPKVSFTDVNLLEEKRPVALLTSDDTWSQVGHLLNLPLVVQAEPEQEDRDLLDYLSNNLPAQAEVIYAVGTGLPIVAGKLVANANNLPLVLVPTALESDALFESFVLLAQDGLLNRIETGPPSEVVVDWNIIQAAPTHLRAAAIADVLAIVTALLDWRYAAKHNRTSDDQRFSAWGAGVAAGLASQAIKSAKAIGEGKVEALRTLLDLLMMSVQLAHQLGHDRHQEGTEHYFAYSLQNQGASFIHAEAVGPGIVMSSTLHGQDPTALQDALSNAGIRLNQLRASDIRLAINDLPTFCVSNDLPFSFAHDLDPLSDQVTQAIGRIDTKEESEDSSSEDAVTASEDTESEATENEQEDIVTLIDTDETPASEGGVSLSDTAELD